jgi:hypothetical protein
MNNFAVQKHADFVINVATLEAGFRVLGAFATVEGSLSVHVSARARPQGDVMLDRMSVRPAGRVSIYSAEILASHPRLERLPTVHASAFRVYDGAIVELEEALLDCGKVTWAPDYIADKAEIRIAPVARYPAHVELTFPPPLSAAGDPDGT